MTGVRTILNLRAAVGILSLLAVGPPIAAQPPRKVVVSFEMPLLVPQPVAESTGEADPAPHAPGRCLYGHMNWACLPDRDRAPLWKPITTAAYYGVACQPPTRVPPADGRDEFPPTLSNGSRAAVVRGQAPDPLPKLFPDDTPTVPPIAAEPPRPLPELQPAGATEPLKPPPTAEKAPAPELIFRFPEFGPKPYTPEPPAATAVTPIPTVPPAASQVVPADCATCGTSNLRTGPATDLMLNGGCNGVGGCTGTGECTPGRFGGDEAMPSHAVGRFLYGVYCCVCTPDPCYEPKWSPLQDAAFFTPSARPVTQTRFRGDLTRGLGTPDRAEYFWAKGVGSTRGPVGPAGQRVTRVDDDALTMYTEGATGRIGAYTQLTYHRVRPDNGNGVSGFGDLIVGTKTLLFDCELLQVTFQFQSTIPTASPNRGLGTGHLTLEPSVILGLKLSANSYLQAQVAELIPIAGDPEYAGSAMRYSFSYNHVLCRPLASCPIIGTLEAQGVTFQDGAYTDPVSGASVRGSGITYLSVGPGIRAFICDRADLGVGCVYGVGDAATPNQEYRIDLRVRY